LTVCNWNYITWVVKSTSEISGEYFRDIVLLNLCKLLFNKEITVSGCHFCHYHFSFSNFYTRQPKYIYILICFVKVGKRTKLFSYIDDDTLYNLLMNNWSVDKYLSTSDISNSHWSLQILCAGNYSFVE